MHHLDTIGDILLTTLIARLFQDIIAIETIVDIYVSQIGDDIYLTILNSNNLNLSVAFPYHVSCEQEQYLTNYIKTKIQKFIELGFCTISK